MTTRRFLLLACAVVLTAFGVREWYVLTATTGYPVPGDSTDYMRYAYNLVHEGVFSRARAHMALAPDDYRGPGYPLLLAAVMRAVPPFDAWLAAVKQVQVVLGSLTVLATMALARQWMPRGAALASGLLIALWPHHVTATQAVLTEILFGLLLVLALLCASLSLRDRSLRWALLGGVAFGLGYLVNPLIALLPVAALVVFWRAGMLRLGAAMLAVSLVAVVGWGLRSATLPPSSGRAIENLVQGSYPDFHDSYRWQNILVHAWHDSRKINRAVATASADPMSGIRDIYARVSAEPGRFAKWYLIQKPYELWDRDIQLGEGGIYFLKTDHSLFEGVLKPVKIAYLIANPILTCALLAFALVLLRSREPAALLCGLTVLYLTALHAVFQAEPRYAIAYRPLECIVVVGAMVWAWRQVGLMATVYVPQLDDAVMVKVPGLMEAPAVASVQDASASPLGTDVPV